MTMLRAAADTYAADWVLQGVRNFDSTVGSVVPATFESYARVFHPAERGDGTEVRWAEVASANGRVMHPAAEWGSLTGSRQMQGQPGLWDQPSSGRLPERLAKRLAELLAPYTLEAARCWFGVWDGWGEPAYLHLFREDLGDEARRRARECAERREERMGEERAAWHTLLGPKFAVPHRDMYLLEGPIDALAEFYEGQRDPPSLWWPDDHAWCVGTDIDLMTTYIGGSQQVIDALLADEQIEALAVPVDQPVTWEADTINPLPGPPY
jgi:hypothetical protein